MTLSDLASLGAFVSGIAVLASHAFLFFQVRRMTEQLKQGEVNQRAILNQGYVTRVTDYLRWYAQSPICELMTRAAANDTSFTADELWRLYMAFRISILNAQDAYLQHRSGLIDAMTLDNSMLSLRFTWLAHPVYRAIWTARASATVSPEFRSVVERMIGETPVSKPDDTVARFNAAMADLTQAKPGSF